MGPSDSNYRDQAVQGGSPNRQFIKEERGCNVERADNSVGRNRTGSPVYNSYSGSLGKDKEKSLASYGSWEIGSHALQVPRFGFKSECFMSPSGDYDMDDSNFVAHTSRLDIIGPKSNSLRFLGRRSLSTERLLINCGERTAATSLQKSDRSLSQPPPILAPEKHTSPTESYIQISLQSSLPLTDPTASRKLLVLDLNGTLLLRSAHSGRRAPLPSYSRVRHSADSHSSSTRPYPALRTIYPRPYIPSFCAYIFHPTTLQWLDTMVWSSAQPHSVNDMVDKCFGVDKDVLKAVWARDTLGLSGDEYYKKTQTTKDLAKPWAQIPSLIPNSQPFSTPYPPDHESASPVDRDSHVSLPQQHSALTTILMDDSPSKAVLQPWNHLRVSEYGSERRKLDVEILEREPERMWLAERERAKEIAEEEKARDNVHMTIKSSEETDAENQEAERKRRRKEKKMMKKEKLLLAKEQQLEAGKEQIGKVEEERYDELLLAVIGILDSLKYEGNVAGWMRSGGLVRVGDQDTISTSEIGTAVIMAIPMLNPQTTSTPSPKRDSSTISPQGPSKRRRLTHTKMDRDPYSTPGERVWGSDSDSEMVVLPSTPRSTAKASLSTSVPSSPLHSSPVPRASSPLSLAQTQQTLIGVPLSTGEATSTPTSGRKNSISTPTPTQHQPQPLLWYEIPSVLSHWAQRGSKALAELGIEIISGVVPPNQNGDGNGG